MPQVPNYSILSTLNLVTLPCSFHNEGLAHMSPDSLWCSPMWPGGFHALSSWELWVPHYFFNGKHLLLCRSDHTWMIIKPRLKQKQEDNFHLSIWKETNNKFRFETCKHYLISVERGVVSGKLNSKTKQTTHKHTHDQFEMWKNS